MILTSLVSRSSTSLLQYLTKVKPDPNAVLLFSLSTNAYNVEAIISRLRSSACHSVGCLSAPLPGATETVVCSLATFPSQDCIPFRSDIPGRAPVQVGRWNQKRVQNVHDILDFTKNSLNGMDLEASAGDPQLPVELHDRRDISTLLFLSDDAPEGFSRSLNHIPQAAKLGLIASFTPFITGRPFTLFYDDHIYSSGAVGVGLRRPLRSTPTVNFHGLVPLSAPMKVSKSEGNLIHKLSHSNPSEMLIEALSASAQISQKEDNFFLGHLCSGASSRLKGSRVKRAYRIISGGPSRGSIALEADNAPGEGEMVQFFHQTPNSPLAAFESLELDASQNPSFHFLCTKNDETTPDDSGINKRVPVQVFQNKFLVSSENGFLCTGAVPSEAIWKCSTPGAVGSLAWTDNQPA